MGLIYPTGPEIISVAFALVAVVFAIAWWFGWAEKIAPDAPAAPAHFPPAAGLPAFLAPTADELQQQQERRARVRSCVTPAARVLVARERPDVPAADDAEALRVALGVLRDVVAENEADGSLGAIASTELCNCLLQEEALKVLERLQSHPDADIAANSLAIFQHAIPRIWSF